MIGKIRVRINLANPKRIANGRGGWTVDEVNATRVNIWAYYELLSVNQQLRYNSLDEAPEGQFTIRYNAALKRDTFIEYGGKKYRVLQYGPVKNNPGFMEIRTREV